MNENARKKTLLQLDVRPIRKIVISLLIMSALICFVYYFDIPNPNMIMIAGLILCSAMYGYIGGVTAAVIMLVYTLYFFSADHCFTRFTPENIQKVGVTLVGVVVDMLLVCSLKQAELKAFAEIDVLNEELKRENELLYTASMTDALTGIRNRLALDQDFRKCLGREVIVMMLDLDKFKIINDTCGHEEGDQVLKETGKLLASQFGKEHCYRYGGDEFLVICRDMSEEAFLEKLDAVMKARPMITLQGETTPVGFSVGYIHETIDDAGKLDELLSRADKRMYQAKRAKR